MNALYHPSAEAHLGALGQSAGFSFNFDAPLSDTMDSHRLVLWAESLEAGRGEDLAQAIGHQYFEGARLLADWDMLVECAGEVGLDPEAALRYLESGSGREEVLASVEAAHRRGIHSIPVFVFHSAGYAKTVHGSSDEATFAAVLREIEAHWATTQAVAGREEI